MYFGTSGPVFPVERFIMLQFTSKSRLRFELHGGGGGRRSALLVPPWDFEYWAMVADWTALEVVKSLDAVNYQIVCSLGWLHTVQRRLPQEFVDKRVIVQNAGIKSPMLGSDEKMWEGI